MLTQPLARAQRLRLTPYALHAGSGAPGGWAARRHRLREAGLWFEDAALAEDAGRFADAGRQVLAVGLNVTAGWRTWDPLAAAGDDAAMLAYHRRHLQLQLDQARRGARQANKAREGEDEWKCAQPRCTYGVHSDPSRRPGTALVHLLTW